MIKNTVLNNELNKSVRQITGRVELYLDGTLVNTFSHNTNLISFDIERIGDENKFFGYGVCQKVNVKVIDRERVINPTTAQHLRIYFNDVRTSPKFYVTEVHRDEKTGEISITAYDKIYFLNNSTVAQLALSTSYTIKQFAQAVGSYSGMKVVFPTGNAFDTNYPNGANFDGTETLRDALDDVAEATSTIYYINHEDKIVFKQLSSEPVLTIDKSKYFDLSSKTNRRLVKIVHVTELGDNVGASLSETGSVQYIRNNVFWELRDDTGRLINQSLDRIGGFTINQFECEWRGNPLLEIGDSISIITKNNESVFSNVFNDTISYDGSLSEKTSFTYEDEGETEEDNPSDLGEALNQTFARVDKVNKEITLLVKDVSDNKTEISEIKQDVDNLSLTVKSTVQEVVKEEIGNVSLNVYTIVLSNEAQTIAVNNDRFPLSSTTFTTDVQVYEGSNIRTDYKIGDIPSANGIKVSKTNSRVSFAVSTSSALTADNGTFTIPITIDNKTFNKTFSWSCSKQGLQGQDGASAKSVTVTGEQVFKYSENFKGTPTPETIILKATVANTTEQGKWQYMDSDGVWTDYTKSGNVVTSKTIDVLHSSKIFGTTDAKSMRLRYFISDSLYDEITLVKVSDGAKGSNGKDGTNGTDGKDGYTIILTNEAQTIPTTSSRVPLSSATYSTDIVVYRGATKRTDFTVGNIASANGITVAKPSNSKVNFTVSTGTALSADSGTFTIPITIDSKTFNKTFSWSCGKQGNKGDKGDTGADAKAVYISGEQVFKYSNNFTGTPTPETIPLTVTKINTTETGKWQYMDENSAWQDFTQGGTLQTGKTLNVSYQSKIFGTTSAKAMRVRYYISNTVYDEVTLVKVSDGAKGTNGKDSYTVILTNENHSFLAGNRGNISTKTSATTKVYAYKGATSVAFTLGTITAPTGMTITDNLATGGRTITFTVATGTNLANSGTIDIPVIVDGITFTKTFSWSKSLKGAQGNAGADAKALNIHATSQIFRSLDGSTYEPSTITLTAKCENVTFSKWQYSLDGSNFVDVVNDEHGMNVSGTDLVISHSSDLFSDNMSSIVFKALATNETYYDTMTIAKVKDLSEDLKDLEGQVITNRDAIASLELNTDSINASVKRVEETFISTVDGMNQNISSLTEKVNATMTSEDVKIEIQKEMKNGVDKVSTSTGFTFDDNGLKVSKSDSEMETQITEDGMKIYKNDETMLTANNQGVDAKNLHATTYLIIGENSRMEDFTCDGTKRTAVFWIGSDN